MKKDKLLKIVIFLFVIGFIITFNLMQTVSQDGFADNNCLNSGCHSEMKFTNMHETAKDDCTNCHEAQNSDHPGAPGKDFKLVEEVPEICSYCHMVMENDKSTHAPASIGQCLKCHNPHGSNTKSLLKGELGKNICLSCHDVTKNEKDVHFPLASQQCTICHNPHSSERLFLLKDDENKLCLNCHSKSVSKGKEKFVNIKSMMNKKYVHFPLEYDVCSSCHDPHLSKYDNLLLFEYHNKNYVYEKDKSVALCFTCHDESLISNTIPESTGFRDADINLHYVHVNREKTRNCLVCHDAHASDTEYMIHQKVRFGKWMLPINFTKTEDGGTCISGCHKEETYHYGNEKPKQSVEAKPGLNENEVLGQIECEIFLNQGYSKKAVNKLRFHLIRLDVLSTKTIEVKNRLNFKFKDVPKGEYSLKVDKADLMRIGATTEKEEHRFRITGSSEISKVKLKYFLVFSSNKHLKMKSFKEYTITKEETYTFDYSHESSYSEIPDLESFLNYSYTFLTINPQVTINIQISLDKTDNKPEEVKKFKESIFAFFADYDIDKKRIVINEDFKDKEKSSVNRISINFKN